jgi:hypothetical protein
VTPKKGGLQEGLDESGKSDTDQMIVQGGNTGKGRRIAKWQVANMSIVVGRCYSEKYGK